MYYDDGAFRWRIYAFTDRPAYRPKETVNWKFIARRNDGSVYSTPANETIHYKINGPDGSVVKESDVTLNAFGSVFGSLDLTEAMRLGEYRVTFLNRDQKHEIGNAALFRLEEYKLPEFKVEVKTPEENGQKKTFRLGDKVEVTIQADYYFGGPVSDASVEVQVHQNPHHCTSGTSRIAIPGISEDMDENLLALMALYFGGFGGVAAQSRVCGGGGEQIIKHETIKTDADGQGDTDLRYAYGITRTGTKISLEYRIEARVVDHRRREITGNGTGA